MMYVGIILQLYYYLYWLLISKERYFNKANLCEVFVFKLYELDRYFTSRMGKYTENRLQKYSKLNSFATQFFHEPFTSMI